MRSMKILLRLLGAVSLATVAASSVVACGGDKAKVLDVKKVEKNLKLYDEQGKGLISPTINVDPTDKSKVTWKIDLSSITVESLVKNDKKAKDKESFDFLKNDLKIKIDSGTKLEDAIFNHEQLIAATITCSDINVNLKSLEVNNDFYVENGSYNIMFTNGSTKTDKYKIVTKLGGKYDNKGVIGDNVFIIQKTDFNSAFQDKFKVGQSVSNFGTYSDLTSMLDHSENNVKTIFGIQKLVNSGTLKLLVTKNYITTSNFKANDKITVRFLIGKVYILVGEELIVNP